MQASIVVVFHPVKLLPCPKIQSISTLICLCTKLTEADVRDVLVDLVSELDVFVDDVSLNKFTSLIQGFNLSDLDALVNEAFLCKRKRIKQKVERGKFCGKVVDTDFIEALDKLQADYGQSIGVPKVPDVRWDDVGGLESVKRLILERVELRMEFPHLFGGGLRGFGVLLYGPPGCGKTLLAKAVATECRLTFLSVKGPELLNMYVGESEKNVREVFERAKSACPCIIFFDELDALAPNRGRCGDSGGVMDRVVSQLLSELDGLGSSKDLFVIGATNRPDLVDPALLRPGRFDKVIYVGLSEDFASRWSVVKSVTRKLNLSSETMSGLESMVDKCPSGMSGADFYAWVSLATTKAMGDLVERIERNEISEKETKLEILLNHFEQALTELKPSISERELEKYSMIGM